MSEQLGFQGWTLLRESARGMNGRTTQISVTTQEAFCTSDDHCKAAADAHEADCPVERRLQEEFGY